MFKLIDFENLQIYDEEIKKYIKKIINESFNECELVVQKDSFILFPVTGNEKSLYIDVSTNKAYRWSETDMKYYRVGSDWEEIKTINGNF